MEDAKPIVKMLNEPPLELGITLLEFCQKNPQQLRQLLYEVLSAILLPQGVDEEAEAKTTWMIELLRVLNCRIDGKTLREGIANGTAEVIHQLLFWLLAQMPMLQKRAYLARFLVDVEIPAEFMLEDDMNMLQAQYNCLREQFKAIHRHLDGLRATDRDPNQIKERVQELEFERDHLRHKILKVKSKLQGVEKIDEMLEVVEQLKCEKMEEEKLAHALTEHKQNLDRSSDMRERAISKLQQVEAHTAQVRNEPDFIQKTLRDNAALRSLVKEKLPKEIESKQKRLCAIQNVLSASDTSDGLAGIQAKLLAVNEEIGLLKKNHIEALKSEGLQWQQEKMGVIIAHKAQAAFDRLANLTACRDKLVNEIDQKHATIDEVKATVRRGEDFKQYVDLLRNKSATYKTMKKEIDDLAAEYGVLVRTQQLLEQEHPSAQNDDDNDVPDQEEKALAGKSDHATISKTTVILKASISEVKASVEEMRSKVNLQVQELNAARAGLQETEIEHEAKKQHYNSVRSLFERKVAKLEADISTISKDCESGSQAVQDYAAAIESLQASVLQLNMEKQDGAVSSKLDAKIEEQKELMNGLQQKQQKLKEMEHSYLAQKAMMKDLLTLITPKLSSYSSGLKPPIFSTATSLENGG